MGFEMNEFLLVYSIHLPDVSLLHPMCSVQGHWHEAQLHPWGQQIQDWYFPKGCVRSASSVHTGLIFIPKCVFPSMLQLPVPELSAALVLPLCSCSPLSSPRRAPASPACSGISPRDATGCQNAFLELSLLGHCWSIVVVTLCSTRLWWVGRGGMAVDSPGPSAQKLLWGWREEQGGNKDTLGKKKGPQHWGFPNPRLIFGL